jgi:NADH dehydrogenase
MPVSGSGRALYQPVWAEDVAEAVVNGLSRPDTSYELAGPEVLSYNDIVRAVLRAANRRRRLLHVPLPLVRASLKVLRFATWEEAELMEEPMVTDRGTADIETLGVVPRSMSAVLP